MKTSTSDQDCLVPSPVFEIAAQVAISHQLTDEERSVLRTAFLEKTLNEEEHRLINRLYRALRRGHLTLV